MVGSWYIWVCKRHENKGAEYCNTKPIKEIALEQAFVRALNGLIENSPQILEQLQKTTVSEITDSCDETIGTLTGEIDKCQEEIANLLSKKVRGEITEQEYNATVNKLKLKIDELTFKRESISLEQGRVQMAEYRLDAVVDLLTNGKILQEFDKFIFRNLVKQIRVISKHEIEIEFECGIKVKENL